LASPRWTVGDGGGRLTTMKRLLAIIPVLILVAFAGMFAIRGLRDPTVIPDALVGKPMPQVSLPPIKGGPPTPLKAALKGPTLVNFFQSTCGPCIIEAPALMAMKTQGVHIVGVAYQEEPQASQAFLNRYGDPFANVRVDRDGRAAIEFGVSGVPETFLVGENGMILAKHSGALTPADADALLAKADQ
jgi:cytochrome c biogenesis protein CcmG/thiol:disulfide interchange protein DsbE